MAKDKKAKAADKKARVAAKTEKKAKQKDKKGKNKPGHDDNSSDDDGGDLDSILAEYARAQEQFLKISETILAAPPPPRSSATVLGNPSDSREVLFFGGESLTNGLASFSNALHIYRPSTDQWRLVTSPNSPLPRSGHAWCRAANTGSVYLFGGEFSSPKQGTFHHYNDFWRLEPSAREWTRVEGGKGGGPSARSGHRMVAHKRYIVLFGGFQDTSSSTRYLGDLWVYDTQTFAWHEPKMSGTMAKPDPRSSFSFLPHESGAVVVGGYSRVKAAAKGKGGGGGGGAGKIVMKPVVHQDCWLLRITEPAKDDGERALPTVRWERRKRPVNLPAPARAGATMVHHKGRGIMFGGVHDVEESEEGIESEFFNQLWAYNIERNRFFPLALRRPRAGGAKKSAVQDRARRGRGKADEEELLRNLALIESKGTLDGDGDVAMESAGKTAQDSDEDEAPTVEKPVAYEMPHPRFNAQLAVQDDGLYLYGGTFEKGDREFTFDELWTIDLGKLDGAKEVFRREIEDWAGAESSDDEDDDDEDEDEEMDDSEDEIEAKASDAANKPAEAAAPITKPEKEDKEDDDDKEELKTSKDDGLPYPRPFESLRAFHARTTLEWQNIVLAASQIGVSQSAAAKSVKEIKKGAFDRAEQRWWDVREEVQQLEDEMDEGGIGEVVQLGERDGAAAGGAGRRR